LNLTHGISIVPAGLGKKKRFLPTGLRPWLLSGREYWVLTTGRDVDFVAPSIAASTIVGALEKAAGSGQLE